MKKKMLYTSRKWIFHSLSQQHSICCEVNLSYLQNAHSALTLCVWAPVRLGRGGCCVQKSASHRCSRMLVVVTRCCWLTEHKYHELYNNVCYNDTVCWHLKSQSQLPGYGLSDSGKKLDSSWILYSLCANSSISGVDLRFSQTLMKCIHLPFKGMWTHFSSNNIKSE